MAFNCIPCTLKQSKEMRFNKNEHQINKVGNKIYKCMYIVLQPGEFIVFRQDLPHQGVGYKYRNARFLMNWDLKGKYVLINLKMVNNLFIKFNAGLLREFDTITKASVVINKKVLSDDLVQRRLYLNPNDSQLNPTKEEMRLAEEKEKK
jgi:hypothetical protein